jgi:hypothetical protein
MTERFRRQSRSGSVFYAGKKNPPPVRPSPGRVEIRKINRLKPFKNGSQGKNDKTNQHEQGRKLSQNRDGDEPAKQTQDGEDERISQVVYFGACSLSFMLYFSFWITENEDEGTCQAGTGWQNRPRVPEEWLIYFSIKRLICQTDWIVPWLQTGLVIPAGCLQLLLAGGGVPPRLPAASQTRC